MDVRNEHISYEKSFGSKKVLRGVNLEVDSGEIVTLVGNNGSGKTTLLRTLTTLDSPDSYHTAEIDGFDLSSRTALARLWTSNELVNFLQTSLAALIGITTATLLI